MSTILKWMTRIFDYIFISFGSMSAINFIQSLVDPTKNPYSFLSIISGMVGLSVFALGVVRVHHSFHNWKIERDLKREDLKEKRRVNQEKDQTSK